MKKPFRKWPLLLSGSCLLLLAGVAWLLSPFLAAPPAVQVTATYPRASVQLLQDSVAPVLKEALQGVENVRCLRSTACTDSTLVTCVYFPLGTDLDQAMVSVQRRLAQVTSHLPKAVVAHGLRTTRQPSSWVAMLRTYGETRRPRRDL